MARGPVWIACMVGIALLIAACGEAEKNATEAAVNAAQSAINAVRAEAEKYTPDQLRAAQNALQSAKDELTKGDYKDALSAAQDAANKAKELAVTVAAKKDEFIKTWNSLNESLPKSMDQVKTKLDAYSKGARLPQGMDKDKLAEAKAQYAQLKQSWADAKASASQGNWGDAIQKATGINDLLAKLKEMLGIKP
jgi:DNA repair exonuclease SbcCD ATPase subunit